MISFKSLISLLVSMTLAKQDSFSSLVKQKRPAFIVPDSHCNAELLSSTRSFLSNWFHIPDETCSHFSGKNIGTFLLLYSQEFDTGSFLKTLVQSTSWLMYDIHFNIILSSMTTDLLVSDFSTKILLPFPRLSPT